MSILDKISKSSRDFLLNGKIISDSKNNQIYNDKLFLNKFLNSHLVNNEFKKKVSNLYSGFFKANTFNNTSNQEILTDKKVKNNNKDTIQSNENSKLSNINLIIKRKLLIDYIKRENKNKKSINDNFIMRRMNRNFSNSSINFMPEKEEKNSWKILKSKIFGKGESFLLQRNFSRDFSSSNQNQNKLFSQIPSLRNINNKNTNRNNDNLSNINTLKMRLNFY